MNALYLSFQQAVDSVVTDPTKRSKIVATAIAVAVASLQSLPTSQVDNTSNYYNTHIAAQVREALSRFNENVVFDLKIAQEQVRVQWMLRYTAAHPIARPIYSLEYGFYDSLLQVATYVDHDQYKFVNENKAQILFLASQAAAVLVELASNGNN